MFDDCTRDELALSQTFSALFSGTSGVLLSSYLRDLITSPGPMNALFSIRLQRFERTFWMNCLEKAAISVLKCAARTDPHCSF
jgi:hypothetical protein